MQTDLHKDTSKYITCKDYTVTKEVFSLLKNKEFDLLITDPIPNNLGKYYESEEYISHTDTNKSIIDKVYQLVRNYTLKKKLKLINSYVKSNKKILDIGCGTGDFLTVCNNNNWTTVGIEPNEKARNISISKGITVNENLEDIKIGDFDVITLWHVLEHIPNVYEYITSIKKLLKKDGTLIIAVPNYKSFDASYYKEHWAAFDVPRHLWHFSKKSISKIFSDFEMSVENILPMKFDSFYVSMLSEKYKKGKINYLKAFYIGLKSNIEAKKTKEYSSQIYILKKSKN